MTAGSIFSTQDHAAPSYTRNSALWLSEHVSALTAISPWNSEGGMQKAGVLISPRHVLFARHFSPDVGATMRWVTADNIVVDRVISSIVQLDTNAQYFPDLTIALLDSDVSASISFARVLPNGFENKLPASIQPEKIPVIFTDQEEKLLVVDLTTLPADNDVVSYAAMQVPTSTLRLNFNEGIVGGDSSSPAFWIINSQLVLLTLWTFAQNGGAGTSVAAFRDEINAAMNTLGGGYQLTPIDLSNYPDEP